MRRLTERAGSGPLWVAWDTNVLSLYEEFGAAMWSGDDCEVRGADPDEVRALGDLISVWMWWDLRFVVLDLTATDSKKRRRDEDVNRREVSMRGLQEALSLGLDGEADDPPGRTVDLPDQVLSLLPKGADSALVRAAYALGMDVFLTPDKGVWRRDPEVSAYGLRCLRPTELLQALADAGVDADWAPTSVQGLAPDLGRMSALLGALGV